MIPVMRNISHLYTSIRRVRKLHYFVEKRWTGTTSFFNSWHEGEELIIVPLMENITKEFVIRYNPTITTLSFGRLWETGEFVAYDDKYCWKLDKHGRKHYHTELYTDIIDIVMRDDKLLHLMK